MSTFLLAVHPFSKKNNTSSGSSANIYTTNGDNIKVGTEKLVLCYVSINIQHIWHSIRSNRMSSENGSPTIMSHATQSRTRNAVVGTKEKVEVVIEVMIIMRQRSYVTWYLT